MVVFKKNTKQLPSREESLKNKRELIPFRDAKIAFEIRVFPFHLSSAFSAI